ncbi:FAD-binding and (Fe-S)-binding domain-containing protein [Brooklawnia cerclae]|uniref:FAD/FMN-containing dehydrogenase/Fe-S oxidoreductase n=1 Tax=Brooklawnia cerclae TaxID=349934 RepID=A0ABX0SHB4_9ACTN|nr:FAD-binding and (Fe-S)-binding domain-containing protein [Brooklawnia cerclae]NIH57355.1 FAD/FMN-containing dehydrogenase/Fe-S oxidoreductase [Brooklawnia cerclae]
MTTTVTTSQTLASFRDLLPDDSCLDESTLARALYSSDASIYRVVPQVVARPRSTDELITVVRAALKAGLPITGRGAGTSCAGNAVGPGLVIDMGRYLGHVLSVDAEAGTAVVEPGVVQSSLQAAVQPHGWRYGPDPSTSNRCTIGGMIGNNACGPRALGYGRSADNIVELEVVTGTGELVTLRPGLRGGVFDQLRTLVDANLATIRKEFGQFSRQVSGYSLEHLLPEHGFDVASFFAGTEGTLGIITRATVRLVRDAPLKTTVALGYPTMADGADAMPRLLPFKPTACEGMDRRLSNVVAERLGPRSVPDLPVGDAWLFIELVGDDASEIAGRAQGLVEASGATEGWVVDDPAQAARLWGIRSDAAGLAAVALEKRAHAGWEDSAVPPARLGAYLRDFEANLERFGLHGLPYGHFGDGCVHCRIDFPLDSEGGTKVLHDFMVEAGKLAAKYGGSMSGEHGDGRARSELLPLMYSPGALRLFGAVKQLFDPGNLLNPGVLVDPDPLAERVRIADARLSPLSLAAPGFASDVHRCTGVGKCLANTTRSGAVMCPSFQATRNEKDSTRGRSRVLQEMVNGTLVSGGWRSPEVAEALELCLACKGCRHDCPTGTDMAAYKSRVLYERHKGRPRPLSHYALGWLPRWGRLLTKLRLGWLANLGTQTPGLKHVIRAVAGVDQRRPMPRFRSGRAASHEHGERPRTSPTRGPVAVWVDSFTDAFAGGQLAALVKLLVSVGYDPRIITQDACCGLTWITTGQLDGARRQLRHALDVLTPIATEGIPIVGMEPSCMAVWRSDAAELLPDDSRVQLVAGGIHTLAELLGSLDDWTPPDLAGHTIVAQPHCHHSSVLGWDADARLLARTGADVVTLGGCCGLAGNFGVERGHYEVSVKVAEHDLLPAIRAAGPDAIVLADGFSCRKQVADLEGRQAITLAQLLASHY